LATLAARHRKFTQNDGFILGDSRDRAKLLFLARIKDKKVSTTCALNDNQADRSEQITC